MAKNIHEILKGIEYPGRGILAGASEGGIPYMVYFITRRSESNQARVLQVENKSGIIRTEFTDPKLLEQGSPALLLYPAMATYREQSKGPQSDNKNNIGAIVASNGTQTELFLSTLDRFHQTYWDGLSRIAPYQILHYAMEEIGPQLRDDPKGDRLIDITTYEPDDNHTPRISAVIMNGSISMHMVNKLPDGEIDEKGHDYQHRYFEQELAPDVGWLLTTYKGGNESPLLLPFDWSQQDGPLEVSLITDEPFGFGTRLLDVYESISHGSLPEENYAVCAGAICMNEGGLGVGTFQHRTENRFKKME